MDNHLRREMNQKTIRYPVSVQGIGLQTGELCTVKLSPSEPYTGISFYLDGKRGKSILYSNIKNVTTSGLSTNLSDDICSVSTVEHLMACLHVLGIDNLMVTVIGGEIPILDGSARPWWNLLHAAEVVEQSKERKFNKILEPFEYHSGNSHIYCEPFDGLEIHMKINFDHPAIGTQSTSYEMYHTYFGCDWVEEFERCFAPARTFGILSQITKAREAGLLKGGSLENAIVLDEQKIVNTELRFKDEFVTHKLVDFLGDIYLSGPILGFFDVCCTSHQFNNHAIRSIFQELN